jgi:dCTP deaminase
MTDASERILINWDDCEDGCRPAEDASDLEEQNLSRFFDRDRATEYVRKDIVDELVEMLEEVLDGLGFLSGGDHELEGYGVPEERGTEIRAALMVVNGQELLDSEPISYMRIVKDTSNGVSFGLSEAGYDIRIRQSLWLFPFRKFKLASTVERFQMPANLVGVVHDKSTWARRGLSVFNTVIEPGWEGWLTLELVYHGFKPLYIPKETGIAQVLFHEISEPRMYNGKYQNQENKPVGARYK